MPLTVGQGGGVGMCIVLLCSILKARSLPVFIFVELGILRAKL